MCLRWSKPLIRFNRFLYVACVLLVEVILPQTLFINPVFPILPRKIPCIFPVKVTYKTSTKKSAKAKTKKLTYTLKVAKVGVALSGDSVVAIGSTTKLTNTKKNSSRAKITYTSSDDSIATVAADGTVTGVKAGKVTITAKITVGKDSAETTKDVEVKNYVLKSVAQNKTNELVATIDGATKNIKASDVTIKTPDNVVLPVKSVSVDSKDATKVTLTTFTDMKDSKEYSVTLDGVTKTFVATDGKVSTISLDKVTIPVKSETEIKLIAKDANGVILKELPYGTSDVNYDFSITTSNGYTKGSKLFLNKVGDTATAEITYKTNKYTTDGKPDGNIGPNKVTITATEQSAVSSVKVKIGDNGKKFSTVKDNDKVAVDETRALYAYFEIKDTDGKEISNYDDYKLESSDKTTLMLADDKMGTNHKVKLIPAKEGIAYIFIKKDDKIISSVPVTVVAARKVTTMSADKTYITLSQTGIAKEIVTLAMKDQYGNDFAYTSNDGYVEVTCESVPDGAGEKASYNKTATQDGNKAKIAFAGSDYPTKEGTYTFKATFKKDGKEVCAQNITVKVEKKGEAGSTLSYDVNILNKDNDAVQTETDAVVNADNRNSRQLKINVSELLKGVVAKQVMVADKLDDAKDLSKQSTVQAIYYTVKNAKGDVVFNNNPSTSAKTNGAINAGDTANIDNGLVVDVVSKSAIGSTPDFTKLAADNYTVTATVVIRPVNAPSNGSKDTKTVVSKSFVVKDTSNDKITDMKVKDAKVDAASVKAALASVLQFSYDGKKYGVDGDSDVTLNIVAIEGYSNTNDIAGKITKDNMDKTLVSGKTADITKVTVKVAFHNDNGDIVGYVTQEVSTSLSITAK